MQNIDFLFGPKSSMDRLLEENTAHEEEFFSTLHKIASTMPTEDIAANLGVSTSSIEKLMENFSEARFSDLSDFALAIGAVVRHIATPFEEAVTVRYRIGEATPSTDEIGVFSEVKPIAETLKVG